MSSEHSWPTRHSRGLRYDVSVCFKHEREKAFWRGVLKGARWNWSFGALWGRPLEGNWDSACLGLCFVRLGTLQRWKRRWTRAQDHVQYLYPLIVGR